jgi:hypothetical protein
MFLVVDSAGQAHCLYTEALDLSQLGSLTIRRASHVEPDSRGRWWADLAPVGGPKLGPFRQRSQGLSIEQKWLEGHRFLRHDPGSPNLSERTNVGLTIHYQLKTHLQAEEDIRFALERMRQAATKLPFKEVSKLFEFRGTEIAHDRDDEHRWFKIQAGQYVQHAGLEARVAPLHIIGFETWPGEGCEPANFGLCRYPASVEVQVQPRRRRTIPTNLAGWRWGSFCKTEYASDPACGGVENFVRCHLLVIQMLDLLRTAGWFEVAVSDESDYWEHRNLEKLEREVGAWNETIAAVVGRLKDGAQAAGGTGGAGGTIEAPITGFANFEHLEAKGADRIGPPRL